MATTPATPVPVATIVETVANALFTELAAAFAGRPLISLAISEVESLVDQDILSSVTTTVTPAVAPAPAPTTA